MADDPGLRIAPPRWMNGATLERLIGTHGLTAVHLTAGLFRCWPRTGQTA